MADKLRYPISTTPVATIVIVASTRSVNDVPWCIEGIRASTPYPIKLVAVLDGVTKDDAAPVTSLGVNVIRSAQLRHFKQSLLDGIGGERGRCVVLQPHVRIEDREWFDKIIAPMQADRQAALALFGNAEPNVSEVPRQITPAMGIPSAPAMTIAPGFCEFLSERIGASSWDDATYRSVMVAAAHAVGATSWYVPTVRVAIGEVRRHGAFVPKSGTAEAPLARSPR